MRRRGRENESESQFVASSSSPRLLTLSLSFLSGPALGLLHRRAPSLALPQKRAREREQIRISFSLLRHFGAPSLTLLLSLTHVPSKDRDTGEPLARVLSYVVGGFILPLPLPRGSLLGRSFLRPPLSQKSKIKNQKSKKTHTLLPLVPGRLFKHVGRHGVDLFRGELP
jgi:hypothetical protein